MALVALVFAGCGSDDDDGGADTAAAAGATTESAAVPTVKDGALTVAFSPSPPQYIVDGTEVTGLVPDILEKFAEDHGLELETFQTSFTGMITAVQTGRADVAAQLYYTEDRANELYYASPYMESGTYWMLMKDTPYEGPESLQGEQIGVTSGYAEIPHYEKFFGKDKVKVFNSDPPGVQALRNGQLAMYSSGPIAFYYANQDPNMKVVEPEAGDADLPEEIVNQKVYVVTSCEQAALGEAIGATMHEQAESGELEDIVKEYADSSLVLPAEDVSPPPSCGK